MKKHSFFTLSLVYTLMLSSFAPLIAQESPAPTLRQRISGMMPRPSLPSWAKGPGFEAAKKWWNAGRDESVLTKKEKRAFSRLKRKVKIGAIISAIIIAAGSTRYYQVRKQRAAQAAAQAQAQAQAAAQAQAQKQAIQERARTIGITTMSGQIMHPQSLDITDNTITIEMPASWIERQKTNPTVGNYVFKITKTDTGNKTYSYTAQATAPDKTTTPLQIRLLPEFLLLTFPKFKKTSIDPFTSNTRLMQFEQ